MERTETIIGGCYEVYGGYNEYEIENNIEAVSGDRDFRPYNWEIVEDAWKKFTSNLDIKRDLIDPKPYSLSIYTDESGNYVSSETIKLPYLYIYDETDYDYDDGDCVETAPIKSCEYNLENHDSPQLIAGGGYMGDIYDTHYGGFTIDCGNYSKLFITKIDNTETYSVQDELGTEGIAVDPK